MTLVRRVRFEADVTSQQWPNASNPIECHNKIKPDRYSIGDLRAINRSINFAAFDWSLRSLNEGKEEKKKRQPNTLPSSLGPRLLRQKPVPAKNWEVTNRIFWSFKNKRRSKMAFRKTNVHLRCRLWLISSFDFGFSVAALFPFWLRVEFEWKQTCFFFISNRLFFFFLKPAHTPAPLWLCKRGSCHVRKSGSCVSSPEILSLAPDRITVQKLQSNQRWT